MSGQSSARLTVSASNSTPPGSYSLSITGVSGAYSHTVSANLVISAPGAIGLNFVGFGSSLAPSGIAGVIPKGNWNNLTANSNSAGAGLVDEDGNLIGAVVTWSGYDPWRLPSANTPADFTLMQGYLDDSDGSAITVSVSGLYANANGYAIYVYADGDNASATRNANYTISTPAASSTTLLMSDQPGVNFNGTYTQVTSTNAAGNYMIFQIPGTSFTLTATPISADDGMLRAPLNGIQIVPQ
jgi:hypothetical protein